VNDLSPGGEAVIPRWFDLRIVAQDPSVRQATGDPGRSIVTATVRVPADDLDPGPRGHRFHVVGYDASAGRLADPVLLLPPRTGGSAADWKPHDQFLEADGKTVVADERIANEYAIHAQNVYAIAARTLDSFESALGRRLQWGFSSHQLFIVPHAFAEANAYYSDDDQALMFGYVDLGGGERVYTCLSHDIVAHETAHAVLDGLRPSFEKPGLPDQAAFHEAFADIVALLSILSTERLVDQVLSLLSRDGAREDRVLAKHLTPEAAQSSVLFALAEQLGQALFPDRSLGLRNSIRQQPIVDWKENPRWEEPHLRGEILVAAVTQTLALMWWKRVRPLIDGQGTIDRQRAAEEGAKAARHLLMMAIRAIDYCPPLEFEFEDFLDAIYVSDQEVAPDDEHGYRTSLLEAFGKFGLGFPWHRTSALEEKAYTLRYDHLNFAALRTQRDEVFRFLWRNSEVLGIRRQFHTYVDELTPSVRVGPDGLIVSETIATYVQTVIGTVQELRDLSENVYEVEGEYLVLRRELPKSTKVRAWGGGTLVFDQFGRAKYHKAKPLLDWKRQSDRLDYLVRNGLGNAAGAYGSSYGISRGQRFAELHDVSEDPDERW
jgi:hypothetical protein